MKQKIVQEQKNKKTWCQPNINKLAVSLTKTGRTPGTTESNNNGRWSTSCSGSSCR